jgi:hypothetical protein
MEDRFSRDSSLPDLSQRAADIRAGLGHSWVLRHVLLVAVTGILAVTVFGIPPGLTALFGGLELVLAALAGLMEGARRRAVTEIAVSTGREGYQRILRASGYYDLVRSLYGMVTALAILVGAEIFFRSALSATIGGPAAAALPALENISVGDLLLLLVAFQFFGMVSSWLRYRWIRSLPETDDFAELNRRYRVIERREWLVRGMPVVAAVLLALGMWHGIFGIPWEIPLVAAGVSPVPLVIGVWDPGRLNRASPDRETPCAPVHEPLREYRDESVSGAVFGVQKIATEAPDIRALGRSARTDRKKKDPENSLIITNRRLLFIQVPVDARSRSTKETGAPPEDCFSHLAEIREKGSEMLKARPLSEVVRHGTRDFAYGDIRKATLKGVVLGLEFNGGGKASYFFMDRAYAETLKNILPQHLGERFATA